MLQNRSSLIRACLVIGGLAVAWLSASRADEADKTKAPVDPKAAAFFESKVRPVLADSCFRCHSGEKHKGGLRVDSLAGLLSGGDSGPAIVAGQPQKSLLIKAISHSDKDLRMPKKKLGKNQIDALEAWVKMGAPWPGADATVAVKRPVEFAVTEQDRAFWSFQPIHKPTVPAVKNTALVANPIDAFVVARLEAKNLLPNALADKRELIRRASFDLLGLPPTPEEIEAFVKDEAPGAWEKLLDRLLASSKYGERWGRHWLDVVRFAQTNGYERDDEKPFAWRYRDYVIQAFNEDKPYDRFILEQLAGDQLEPVTPASVIATGYYHLGVWDDEPDDARQASFDELDDILSTTSQTFLGLSVGCARCHNHKFDPISQRNYYEMLSFFHNIKRYDKPEFSPDSPTYTPLGSVEAVEGWRKEFRQKHDILQGRVKSATDKKQKDKLHREIDELKQRQAPFPVALAVKEQGPRAPTTQVLLRGNAGTPGEEVQPSFLDVLSGPSSPKQPSSLAPGMAASRRKVLAQWIASPENPLTARVMVNRVWQYHFGRGIVASANDFGKVGLAPTHPELLDWMAHDFVAGGWKIKQLHKTIMLSHTYRLSSRIGANIARASDEGNDLLWRQNLRRLEAEAIRDTILVVSGNLNPEMGGRGFFPRLSRQVIAGQSKPGSGWEMSSPSDECRRSVYLFTKRTMLLPMMESFDYTNTASSLGTRPITTVAPQALMLLNSEFLQRQADSFAERVTQKAGSGADEQVRMAYHLALGRQPAERERRITLDYLRRQSESFAHLEPRITFGPTVPSSLSTEYLGRLKPVDFLSGPREGWTYYRGKWGNGYSGIEKVEPTRGPFALASAPALADSVIEGRIMLHPASELGGVIFRAVPHGDVFVGYEVSLDPRNSMLRLRRHAENELSVLAEAKASIRPGREVRFKIEARGAKIQVWFDGSDRPLIDVTDPRPINRPGALGLRAWGAPLSCQEMVAQSGDQVIRVDVGHTLSTAEADKQALKSLCLVILNLNEFVYVD